MAAILYINNTYISTWEEFKKLVVQTFSSGSDKAKFVQDEIMSYARDGRLFDWSACLGLSFSNELDPNKFLGMTDGDLRKFLLDICGAESIKIYRPNFSNHIEIINEYKIFENDLQIAYSLTTPIPIGNAINRKLQIGLRIINPINDVIEVNFGLHKMPNKVDKWLWEKSNFFDKETPIFYGEGTLIDLKTKGRLYYLTIDITDIKSDEAISLYAEGERVYTIITLPEYEYIDLGLDVKWATCNLGAKNPEEPGDYFAWGDSKPRESFYKSNYYNGFRCGDISGNFNLDAATIIRGIPWRIPNNEEWADLYRACDLTRINIRGIPCIKFTSRINNNYIILPYTGYISESRYIEASHSYWSSNCKMDRSSDCEIETELAYDDSGNLMDKYTGHMIRPIYDDRCKINVWCHLLYHWV